MAPNNKAVLAAAADSLHSRRQAEYDFSEVGLQPKPDFSYGSKGTEMSDIIDWIVGEAIDFQSLKGRLTNQDQVSLWGENTAHIAAETLDSDSTSPMIYTLSYA